MLTLVKAEAIKASDNGKSTSNMFIFNLEGKRRQEAAGFMGNVVVILREPFIYIAL